MIKKSVLHLMDSSENISKKLFIISAYIEFHNFLLARIEDNFKEQCVSTMDTIFEAVVTSICSRKHMSFNADKFMKVYFAMLSESELFSSSKYARSTITYFSECSVDWYCDNKDYVKVIKQFKSIPLASQVDIIIEFRGYIDNMFRITSENKVGTTLEHEVLDMLLVRLNNYLKDKIEQGVDFDTLSRNLRSILIASTEDYLMQKFIKGELGLEIFRNIPAKVAYSGLNATEQKMWLIYLIYRMVYGDNDKQTVNRLLKKMDRLLGISNELEMLEMIVTLWFAVEKFTKAINRIDSMNAGTFSDKLSDYIATPGFNIRNYLKSFFPEEIANSVYFVGIDFDTAPMDIIMEALYSLEKEVSSLRSSVSTNFETQDEEHLPEDFEQDTTAQDCYKMEAVLKKAFQNPYVYNEYVSYRIYKMQNPSGPTQPAV